MDRRIEHWRCRETTERRDDASTNRSVASSRSRRCSRSRSRRRSRSYSRRRSRSRRSSSSESSSCSRIRSRSRTPKWVRRWRRSHSRRGDVRLLELEIQRERERIRGLEQLLQRQRTGEKRVNSNEHSHSSVKRQTSCKDDDPHDTGTVEQHLHKSSSPSFSTKDIVDILRSIKHHPSQSETKVTSLSHSTIDNKNILPEFDPSLNNQRIDIWLRKVNECASVYGWDEKTTTHFALQKLQGLAKVWYQSLNTILYDWTEWQEKLIKAFPYEENYGQSLENMLRRRSMFNEPIEKYFYEKLSLLNQCDIANKRAVDCIIHGLSDNTLRSSALALRCSEPDELLQFLLSYKDSNQQNLTNHRKFNSHNSDNFARKSNSTPFRSGLKSNIRCYNCKEFGHSYARCTKLVLKCERCARVGHKKENCPEQSGEPAKLGVDKKTMCISVINPNGKYFKNVKVNGVLLEAFIDFGSEVTLIKESVLTQLGVRHDNMPTVMRGFGDKIVSSVGTVLLNFTVDEVDAQVPCRVVEDKFLDKSILVGQTFSEQQHIVVYKDSTKLEFRDVSFEMPYNCVIENDEKLINVRMLGYVWLYGTASIRAATDVVFTGEILLNTKIVGKPNEQYIVSGGVYEVKNGTLAIVIIPCSIPCILYKNLIFSRAEKVQVVYREVKQVLPISNKYCHNAGVNRINETNANIGEAASDNDKIKLVDLIKRYEHCFVDNIFELGCTDITEMEIELNSQCPIVYRPYRLSCVEREKVRDMVDEMLRAGIIRESVSNYASPIVLVKKKDGKVRMCVDYRKLNSVTIKERYPLPIIEDEISRLAGQAWFIVLDLMSGYYQVPISERNKHLTAFVTPDGQYEFNRMPFGLANAPAVFQRMMNRVLGPARFNKATVYIDDLLIYGRTSDECLDRLEEILKLLEKANLKLNFSKCKFLQNKIDYLGYEISSSGIQPGEAKIECVINFRRPENVHGVRQFLGLVSYFRKFIKGFAQLASPLTKLLKKNTKWQWDKEQEEAFTTLKKKLTDRPVLAIYNVAAETELHTDASRIGVGAILLQKQPGHDSFQPVAYYSRQTTPEEKNFHSYELETLAVVCGIRKFRVFLLGKTFKIITDCSALRSTFQKRDLIPRIARWWLALQEFDYTVEYRAGIKMSHVDALSRNPNEKSLTEDVEQLPNVMTISSNDWLHTLQLGDSELQRICNILTSKLEPKELQYITDNYVLRGNKLFRCMNGDKEDIRWVVPKGARWQLCKMNHDEIGHVGFEKTLDRIKKCYWFSKMTKFVKKYVGSCIECAYAKKSNNTREGLLHPITKIDIPFHTLHIDHLGPFVKSKKGNTHILTVVDSFTKFVFIKPVRNTNTQNVIKVLEQIFDTFRNPDRIISDRGSCFTSHAFKAFCNGRGIRHVLNAVASPRSNGQVERYNRTILDSLRAQNLKNDEKEWDSKLGKIQWGLNNTLQKTIGRTPAEVMFGTNMNGEVKSMMNDIIDETRKADNIESLRREVKDRIDKQQKAQKRFYDRKRHPARDYKIGDLVKITKTVFQNDGKSTKLLPPYEGPYKVIKILGNDRYKVAPIPGFEGMKNKRKTTLAADRMQPWIHVKFLEVDDDKDDKIDTCSESTVNDSD